MKKSMEKSSPWIIRLYKGLVGVGALFFIASMLLAVANMLLRPIGHSIAGSYELLGFGCAAFVALGLGFSGLEKVHIAVDIVMRFLPQRLAKYLEAMGFVISGASTMVASYGLFNLTLRYIRVHEVSETLQIPFYPVVAIVALGFLLFGLALFINAYRVIR